MRSYTSHENLCMKNVESLNSPNALNEGYKKTIKAQTLQAELAFDCYWGSMASSKRALNLMVIVYLLMVGGGGALLAAMMVRILGEKANKDFSSTMTLDLVFESKPKRQSPIKSYITNYMWIE